MSKSPLPVPDETTTRREDGAIVSHHAPGTRERVLKAAYPAILQGKTLKQIAAEQDIPPRTLSLWLHAQHDYAELRQTWLDSMLADAAEAIEDETGDQLQLARARERWRKATWYAERRDPARYGARLDTGSQAAQIVVHTSLSLSPREGYVIDQQDDEEAADGEAE